MTIPLQFASLYDGQEIFVWSDCLLDLGTDFFVGTWPYSVEPKLTSVEETRWIETSRCVLFFQAVVDVCQCRCLISNNETGAVQFKCLCVCML